jgi:hypothetical protein
LPFFFYALNTVIVLNVETVYCTYIPEEKTIPSSGIVISLVAVAEATVPNLNNDEPVGLVVKKSNNPAVPVHTRLMP